MFLPRHKNLEFIGLNQNQYTDKRLEYFRAPGEKKVHKNLLEGKYFRSTVYKDI